jgi:hypothetical protein
MNIVPDVVFRLVSAQLYNYVVPSCFFLCISGRRSEFFYVRISYFYVLVLQGEKLKKRHKTYTPDVTKLMKFKDKNPGYAPGSEIALQKKSLRVDGRLSTSPWHPQSAFTLLLNHHFMIQQHELIRETRNSEGCVCVNG